MRKDIFVLIFGNPKTGTSLCRGLLDSSPRLNMGNELNNNCIYPEEDILILSKEFNGNKVGVGERASLSRMKFLIENEVGIMHDRFDVLKVIFTKRDPINALVCRHGYFLFQVTW